jgi:hypothetical protein
MKSVTGSCFVSLVPFILCVFVLSAVSLQCVVDSSCAGVFSCAGRHNSCRHGVHRRLASLLLWGLVLLYCFVVIAPRFACVRARARVSVCVCACPLACFSRFLPFRADSCSSAARSSTASRDLTRWSWRETGIQSSTPRCRRRVSPARRRQQLPPRRPPSHACIYVRPGVTYLLARPTTAGTADEDERLFALGIAALTCSLRFGALP